MEISIDDSSGFCWGVVRTIEIVEGLLAEAKGEGVYVLGEIIHNPREIDRLNKMGLRTIKREDLAAISGSKSKVIVRAHGEPPSTFALADNLGVDLVDATCPLVTSLQNRVGNYYKMGYQIVIFGKREHAEVIGIRGVCNDECIVVRSAEEALEKVDLNKRTVLFSQTTMNKFTFSQIRDALKNVVSVASAGEAAEGRFVAKNTICKYVADRDEKLRVFAAENDAALFVAGRNSSNGKSLFKVCRDVNKRTHFIEDVAEIDYSWFAGAERLGVTGATSTPQWYLTLVKDEIEKKMRCRGEMV